LTYLIDKVLGKTSCEAIKTILQYSINQSEYFAKKIYDLGSKNWKKHEQEISFILITRSEIDLYSIQLAFNDNLYADGKLLTQWVSEKTNESKTGLFLVLLLQSLAKNKNHEEQTQLTIRAIESPMFSGEYSQVFSPGSMPRPSLIPVAFDKSGGGKSLTIGYGAHTIRLDKGVSILDSYEESKEQSVSKSSKAQKRSRKKSESKSVPKKQSITPEKHVPYKINSRPKDDVSDVEEAIDSLKPQSHDDNKPAATITPLPETEASSTVTPLPANTKMKKLTESARQEMAKKIVGLMTKKIKLSEIDLKNKNNKIEPDELFDFFKRKNIGVPRYISNIVFSNIDINGDGHITMYEYFKWKSKVSVVKMYDLLPTEIPDIADDDSYFFEGIPPQTPVSASNHSESEEKRETNGGPQLMPTTSVSETQPEGHGQGHVQENEGDSELNQLEKRMDLYKHLLDLRLTLNSNKPLNRNIFAAFCKKNKFGLSKDQIYRIFDDMDNNGDGVITTAEYFQWRDRVSMGYLNDLLKDTKDISEPPPAYSATAASSKKKEAEQKEEEAQKAKEAKTELKEIADSPYSKDNYGDLEVQITILVDENRKKWSLYLLDWNDDFNAKLSFLDFVKTNLSDKITTQLFNKFGKDSVVESGSFAELLTFTYTLYRKKLQRTHYSDDASFRQMKNNEVRPRIEHFVIWVIRTFGTELKNKTHTVNIQNPFEATADGMAIEVGEFNEYQFTLQKDSYSKDLEKWIQKYIEEKAHHDDAETAWMILQIWLE